MACWLAFVYVVYSFGAKKGTDSSSIYVKSNEFAKASENGICSHEAEGSTDIIIVGAGVAGAALAYTLGKVGFYFWPIFESMHFISMMVSLLLYI